MSTNDTSTSSWKPLKANKFVSGCRLLNVPYGAVVNSTNNSGPLDVACGTV